MAATHLRCAALAAACLLAACSDAPSESDLRGAVERVQEAWAQQQRAQRSERTEPERRALPNIDLSFEARLALRITEFRKVGCRRVPDQAAWLCTFEVTASLAGQPPVWRVLQGRFTHGLQGWVARDIQTARRD